MGTDAWFYIEYREVGHDEWHAVLCNDSGRDYGTYDAIGGGVSGGGCLFPPRGLPSDCSLQILESFKDGPVDTSSSVVLDRIGVRHVYCLDGYWHNFSWLTLAEVQAAFLTFVPGSNASGRLGQKWNESYLCLILVKMNSEEVKTYMR